MAVFTQEFITEFGIKNNTDTVTLNNTDFLALPTGTNSQRGSPRNGCIRYNTDTPGIEAYVSGSWVTFGGIIDISGKVNKSGDTMTGTLNIQDSAPYLGLISTSSNTPRVEFTKTGNINYGGITYDFSTNRMWMYSYNGVGWDQIAVDVTGIYSTTYGDYLHNIFESQSHASSTYETQSHASSTYETQSHASSTYETQSHASSTYETQSHASITYYPKTGGDIQGNVRLIPTAGAAAITLDSNSGNSPIIYFATGSTGNAGTFWHDYTDSKFVIQTSTDNLISIASTFYFDTAGKIYSSGYGWLDQAFLSYGGTRSSTGHTLYAGWMNSGGITLKVDSTELGNLLYYRPANTGLSDEWVTGVPTTVGCIAFASALLNDLEWSTSSTPLHSSIWASTQFTNIADDQPDAGSWKVLKRLRVTHETTGYYLYLIQRVA